MARLIPQLWHLPAPTGTSLVRLDRFSPYWRAPEMHGVTNLRPYWSYDHVYASLTPEDRMRIAYFFEYDHTDGRNPRTYAAETVAAIAQWRSAYNERHATLEILTEDAQLYVVDTRTVDKPMRCHLSGADAALLKVLDTAVHRDAIGDNLGKISSSLSSPSELEIAEMLDRFLQSGWIVREGDLFLSVVLDRTERNRVADRRVDLRLAQFGLAEHQPSARAGEAVA